MAIAIADALPEPYILDAKEIIDLATSRIRRFADRDALYDLADLYYYGSDLSDGSVGVLAANAQGRPLLRDLENYKQNGKVYSAQRLSPIIDDYQALLGQMPSSRVDPPQSSPEGEKHAELVTKFLISTHDISDMERQQIQAGFDLPAYGDACYVLEVDSELKRVVWSVVKPRTAYPEFYRGHKKYMIADLIIRTVEEPDVIRRAYGFTPKTNKEKDCAVTIYISAFQRTVVIGTERIEVGPDVKWKLGFCPAQWVFNKVNGRYGQSDIQQSFAQQDFMDFAYNILIDGLVRNTYGTIIGIRNPQNAGQEQIQIGPNPPPIMLQEDGSITATQVGGDVTPAMKMIDHTLSDINATTGTSQVRQEGQMHGSIQTGRGMHAAQGPQATRVELKLTNLGAALKSANSMTIEVQINAPYIGKASFDIFGKFKGQTFSESLSGEELKWQGAVWTRNSVRFDAMIGLNLQQKEQIATQGMMSEIWDDIHARELVGVDDPIGMRGRIEQMKLLKAGVEAKVQAAMQPPGAGGPGGGSPGSPPPGSPPGRPGGGAPGGAPPSPGIKRPMGMGAAPPSGGAPGAPPPPATAAPPPTATKGTALGVAMKDIQTALAGMDKPLRGSVWVIGDVAMAGSGDKVQLLVEDARDQPPVAAAMRTIASIVQVRAAKPGKELPVEAVKVA